MAVCTMTNAEAARLMPARKFNHQVTERGIGRVLNAGDVKLTIGNDIKAISPLACVPWFFRQ